MKLKRKGPGQRTSTSFTTYVIVTDMTMHSPNYESLVVFDARAEDMKSMVATNAQICAGAGRARSAIALVLSVLSAWLGPTRTLALDNAPANLGQSIVGGKIVYTPKERSYSRTVTIRR